MRVLKIKLWMHFKEKVLKEEKSLDNPCEMLDINMA